MPLTNLASDALGAVTICLVVLLVLLGLICIIYTLFFCARIQSSAYTKLGYFNRPSVVRIIFIVLGIFWGAGEVVRLRFFRQDGEVFHSLSQQWQEDICKIYILLNLGFTEPCLFLSMGFLLRASLKWRESSTLFRKWNFKTIGYVLLYCFPIFILDLLFVTAAPNFIGEHKLLKGISQEFTRTYLSTKVSGLTIVFCTYPLLSTILHGLFAAVVTTYLLFLGRRVAKSVINKGLQKRVYILVFLVSSFLPLRVLFLGFSVLTTPEHVLFETLIFGGFLVLLSCVVVAIFMLVYLPIADSLALKRCPGLRGLEAGRGSLYTSGDDPTDNISLIATNLSHLETSTTPSLGRDSDLSTKGGSVSFQTIIKDGIASSSKYEEEMTIPTPGFRLLSASSPGSPAAPAS